MTDRAVSSVVTYLTVLGMLVVLTTGLFVMMGDFVGAQQERAVRTGLSVAGNDLAADLDAVDRLARTEGSSVVVLESSLPDRIAGRPYDIEVESAGGDRYHLRLGTEDPSVTVLVTVESDTPIETGRVAGGDLELRVDGSGAIEVTDA